MLDPGNSDAEGGQIDQGHHLGVCEGTARSDQASKVAVQATNRVLGQPVQRRGGERGVDLPLGNSVDPCRASKVGSYDAHAVVAVEGR